MGCYTIKVHDYSPAVLICNSSIFTEKQLSDIKDLIHYFIESKFVRKRISKLNIQILVRPDYCKKTGKVGSCIWEDNHYRPNEYTIEIDSGLTFKMFLNTLVHELTHVHQWAMGKFFEVVSVSKKDKRVYKFSGKNYDTSRISYHDHPWEIEAMGASIFFIIKWINDKKLDAYKYLPEEFINEFRDQIK